MIQIGDIAKGTETRAKNEKKNRYNSEKIIRLKEVSKQNIDDTWDFFQELGCMDGHALEKRNYRHINDVWKDEPAYIVGAGPALKEFLSDVGWDFLRGKHTIGINHVIEDFDGFEWFFFLDKRFLKKTTYPLLEKYKGRIFAQNTTGLKPADNICIFNGTHKQPSRRIEDGLYSPSFSGLAALNLALLTGANPIYLLGYGNGAGANADHYHYKKDYTGETKNEKTFKKFISVLNYYKKFSAYKNRVIHVTVGDDIPTFRKIKPIELGKLEIIPRNPKIIHYSFTDDILKHADITRHVYNECIGNHEIRNINEKKIPNADLYILEHFISTNKQVNLFPYKGKSIDIVHSTNCIPRGNFAKIIALTHAWKHKLKRLGIQNISVIPGGIEIDKYKDITPTDKKVFGRITRWSKGKINPEWNRIVQEILEEVDGSKCLIYTGLEYAKQRAPLMGENITYDKSVSIDQFKGDALKNLSVYVHANATFKETLSFAVIEAMATGLPIVYLTEGTGVLEEVTGNCGIGCNNINQVRDEVVKLLKDTDKRNEYGAKAKARARFFDKQIMVEKFNEVIKECLKK